MPPKKPIESHIFSPDRAVDNALEMVQDRMENPHTGITQGIPGADFLDPWRLGELIALVGYTSNGKSSLANYIATQHAYKLRSFNKEHPDYRHVVLYITWEQAIEEQTVLDLSRVTAIPSRKIFRGEITKEEFDRLLAVGVKDRRSLPIWLVGSSVMDDRKRGRLDMQEVNEALVYMEDTGKLVLDLIIMDYLQRIKGRQGVVDMRERYMDIVDSSKDIALRCPVLVLSQAGRQVAERKWALPGLADGQETSNLEQSSQHYWSCWMPKQNELKTFTLGGMRYAVDEHTLVVGYLKQTNGPAPITKVYRLGFGGSSLEEQMPFEKALAKDK